jgi:hypothetical protein
MSEKDSQNILNSLSDMSGDEMIHRRDRSASNEKFELPPLPDFYDNKDLNEDMDDNGDYLMNNYKSNEMTNKKNIFSGLAIEDDDDELQLVEKPNSPEPTEFIVNFDGDELGNASTSNNAPSSMFELLDGDDLDRMENDEELFKNFNTFEQDILREMKETVSVQLEELPGLDLEAEEVPKKKF